MPEKAPDRGPEHERLSVFLGNWQAKGLSYGGVAQSAANPKANSEKWVSTYEAYWHTGSFFLIQSERAAIDGNQFDTLSVMGVDPETKKYFVRSFENHGFYRCYELSVEGNIWTLSGDTERARIEFHDDNRRQVIYWEWMPENEWLPLCEREAVRID